MQRDQKFYTSKISFYRSISYLKIAGFVDSTKQDQFNVYFLTNNGIMFATWLSFLPDNNFMVSEFENKYGKNQARELEKQTRKISMGED